MANEWQNNNFKTIVFPSNAGTDSQSEELINYLSENATPSALTSVDLAALDLSAGQHTIKVKATATGYADSDFSNSVTYSVYEQLAAPVCSISGNTLSWAAISNAASYTLYVDDVSTQTGLTGTSFDLSTLSLAEGTYSIQLQAIGSGYYTNSDLSVAVEYVVSAPSTMPSKGDLITMNVDGTDKQFRVLNVNGNNAEVVMMSNAKDSQQFASSGQIYAGSALDTYLNSTWYDTLTSTAKTAIVDKTFTQDSWYYDASGDPDYSGYYGTSNPGTSAYTISLGNAAFGSSITRHVYALSVQDVLDYVLDTSITDGQLQNYNIWKMFWDITTQPPSTPQRVLWLRSAFASSSSYAFYVNGYNGYVNGHITSNLYAVRPAFTIDLTKISWS